MDNYSLTNCQKAFFDAYQERQNQLDRAVRNIEIMMDHPVDDFIVKAHDLIEFKPQSKSIKKLYRQVLLDERYCFDYYVHRRTPRTVKSNLAAERDTLLLEWQLEDCQTWSCSVERYQQIKQAIALTQTSPEGIPTRDLNQKLKLALLSTDKTLLAIATEINMEQIR